MNIERKWKCKGCDAILLDTMFLKAPSPFDPMDELLACPECRQCNEGFDGLCDEPGCIQYAGTGWPDGKGGYRYTCSNHYRS